MRARSTIRQQQFTKKENNLEDVLKDVLKKDNPVTQ